MTEHQVTCIPGDGIGPEIMAAAKVVVQATGVDIRWHDVEAGVALLCPRP
jgi:isocitrate dehydrogenase (NAD+)